MREECDDAVRRTGPQQPAIFVIHRWRRVQGPMIEARCAEGNFNVFNQDVEPLPTAATPDF